MKILISIFLLLTHLVLNAQNDPELFPINDGSIGFFGYYLKDGKTNVVKPQFCSASYNTDGYYLVSKAEHEYYEDGSRKENHIPNTEKFGLLNSKGQFIIDFNNNYDYFGVIAGTIYVKKNNHFGVVDDQNEIVIPIIYDHLQIVNKNFIIAQLYDKFGVFNQLGDTIIPFNYNYISSEPFYKGNKDFLVIVEHNKQFGVINQNNQFVVQYTNIDLRLLTNESIIAKKNNKIGLLDYKLKKILPFEFEELNINDDKIVGIKKGYIYSFTFDGKLIEKKEITVDAEKSSQ